VVQADYDNSGLLGMAAVYPGYLAVRHTLFIECDAAHDTVQAAIDEAQRCTPICICFAMRSPSPGRWCSARARRRRSGMDALARALREAGLSSVTTERIATTADYADAQAACDAAFIAGPVALAYSRFDDATRSKVHTEYLASIAAWGVESGYSLPGEFVIGSARLA